MMRRTQRTATIPQNKQHSHLKKKPRSSTREPARLEMVTKQSVPDTSQDQQEIAAVFVDIEDSTGIANHYASEGYRDFLKSFHSCIRSVVSADEWAPIRAVGYHNFFGDEFTAFLSSEEYQTPVSSALDLACRLKCAWYLCQENRERLDSDKEIIELNIGINHGRVYRMEYPLGSHPNRPFTLEGFPITVAKRAQSVCEEGRASRVVLADRAYREYVRTSLRSFDFSYMGRRQLKGFTQALSCYEWLGDDFEADFDQDDFESVLKVLNQKNPLNPWYALLLARYYFHRAEREWYEGNIDNQWYRTTASLCLSALQTISGPTLRTLTDMLLTCLEVQKKWWELAFRAEQAFVNDPTYAYALGFRAKALLGLYMDERQDKHWLAEAEREAKRTITLFSKDEVSNSEPLFIAYLVQGAVHSIDGHETPAIDSLLSAAEQAKSGGIRWAGDEILSLRDVFQRIENHPKWTALNKSLEALRSGG